LRRRLRKNESRRNKIRSGGWRGSGMNNKPEFSFVSLSIKLSSHMGVGGRQLYKIFSH